MTFNKKLLIAGLAIGISAYAAYKISKKHEKQKISSGQQYQWNPVQNVSTQHTSSTASSGSGGGGHPPSDVWWASLRDPNHIADILSACVTEQHLYAFYDYAKIQAIAQHIAHSGALYDCCEAWELPPSLGQDLVKLALFDISFLLDDSLSMQSEGHLRRDALKSILKRAADAGARFDPDGMEVQWMNGQKHGPNRLRSAADASEIVSKCKWDGKATPMGFALEQLLQMNVLSRAENNALLKPSLVIIITDGRPTGQSERDDKIVKVIRHAKHRLSKTRYGADAISFSICAVGNDADAQKWLDSIDSNPEVGSLVDVTSDRRKEAQQVKAATGIELTEELHCLKVLLGGIDNTYDASDENSSTGRYRQASRKSSMDLHRSAFESFETQRWQVQSQEAYRLGVPAPAKPPFVREESIFSSQSQQQWGPNYNNNSNNSAMPPTQPGWSQAPSNSYQPPSQYQSSTPVHQQAAPYQAAPYQAAPYQASQYANTAPPAQSYGGPPFGQAPMQAPQDFNSPYPPSQAPYMTQPQNPYPYSQPSVPSVDNAFPPPYAQQGGSSYNDGVGGFMMPSASPASNNYNNAYQEQGQPGHTDHKGGFQFPSAYPS